MKRDIGDKRYRESIASCGNITFKMSIQSVYEIVGISHIVSIVCAFKDIDIVT